MRFTVEQASFATLLGAVGRAVAGRTTLPALSHVLLTADPEAQRLVMRGTNFEIASQAAVPAVVEVGGALTLPAKLVGEWLAKLPGGQLEAEGDTDKGWMVFKLGRYRTRVDGYPAAEFPEVNLSLPQTLALSTDLATVKRVATGVAIAASKERSRPAFTGVNLKLKDGCLTWTATDGFRLGELRLTCDDLASVIDLTIPAAALVELLALAKDTGTSGPVGLYLEEKRVVFALDPAGPDLLDVRLGSQLIEVKYPNTAGFVPKTFNTTVRVEASALKRAVAVSHLFAEQSSVSLKASANGLTVRAVSDEGENVVEIDADVEGKEMGAAFSADYILDALEAAGTAWVLLKLVAHNKPALLLPDGDENYTYLMLPRVPIKAKEENT